MINYTWQIVKSAIAINFVRSLDFYTFILSQRPFVSNDSLKAYNYTWQTMWKTIWSAIAICVKSFVQGFVLSL